jgi:hypothetical protein
MDPGARAYLAQRRSAIETGPDPAAVDAVETFSRALAGQGLSYQELRVFLYLQGQASAADQAVRGSREIARRCHMDTNAVRPAVARLEVLGMLLVRRGVFGSFNSYCPTDPRVWRVPDSSPLS